MLVEFTVHCILALSSALRSWNCVIDCYELGLNPWSVSVLQMDGLQASTLIQQMYAPDDRPRIIAVSADTLQVRCSRHRGIEQTHHSREVKLTPANAGRAVAVDPSTFEMPATQHGCVSSMHRCCRSSASRPASRTSSRRCAPQHCEQTRHLRNHLCHNRASFAGAPLHVARQLLWSA